MVWSVWVSGMAGGYVLSPELLLQPKSLILVTAPPHGSSHPLPNTQFLYRTTRINGTETKYK